MLAKKARPKITRLKIRIKALWRLRWVRISAMVASVLLVILSFVTAYYYVTITRILDARLHGERDTVLPRVFARPLELRRGQSLTDRQLVDRLNDLGYTQRPKVEHPGEFAIGSGTVALIPRGAEFQGKVARVIFQKVPAVDPKSTKKPAPPRASDRVTRLELGAHASERLVLDAPVLTSLASGEREKRRPVALTAIPARMVDAVLSIEDRRFYESTARSEEHTSELQS